MSGKVGAPNPDFTKLRTDVGLLSTKLMRMHVGARGGEIMMQHFKDLIDSSKQSPENLLGALDEIDQYAKETASERPGAKSAEGSTTATPASSGKSVSLSAAKALPINKGKSDDAIRKDIKAHGHKVID